MKKLSDEDLQRILEQGNLVNNGDIPDSQKNELEVYAFLFKQLKKEPEGDLPFNFAAKTANRIQAQTKRTNVLGFYLLIAFVLSACFAVVFIMLYALNDTVAMHLSTILLPYKWVVLFILSSIMMIQYIDQKLVKEPKGLV